MSAGPVSSWVVELKSCYSKIFKLKILLYEEY